MKKTKKLLPILLAASCLLSYAGCAKTPPEVNPDETDEIVENAGYTPLDYLETYGDYGAADKWLKEKIEDTDVPPVYFEIDGTDSTQLNWTKTVGEEYTVVSYEDTDSPAERICQKIEYVCADKGLKLEVTLTSYEGYPVIEYDTRLINIGEGNSPEIKNVQAINTDVAAYSGSVTAHYNEGGHYSANAWAPHTQALTPETPVTLNTDYGLPSDTVIPYFNIENTADETGVIAVLNWQGGWKTEFSVAENKILMKSGMVKTHFAMLPEENLKLPGMVLLFYKDGDWQYGQNIWRRWILEHNYMRETGERDFFENVYLCSDLSSGTEYDLSAVEAFAATDIPERFNCTVEYDGGWYIMEGTSFWAGGWENTGNWTPKAIYADGGLKKVSDLCRENGIAFSIWVEPERAVTDSQQAVELGDENMIYTKTVLEAEKDEDGFERKRQVPYYMSYNEHLAKGWPMGVGLINYSREEAQQYVIDLINRLIKEHGITVYRQDFNVVNADSWAAYDRYIRDQHSMPRTGITEMKACEGYINVWSALAEQNPGLVFDACAGGGRRLDLETVRYSFAHTKTDYVVDTSSQQGENFGFLSWLPVSGTAFLSTTDYGVRSALTLSVGIGLTPPTETLEHMLTEWKSLHKYMLKDYYQLSEYTIADDANLAMQFADHEAGEGMMIGYLRNGGEYEFKAKALDPEANYKVWDQDVYDSVRVMTGKALMEEGFYVSYGEGRTSAVVVWYEMTDEEVTPFDKASIAEEYAIPDEALFEKQTNNEAALVELHKASGVQGNQVAFLCADADKSGGIYAVGRDFYDGILTTEQQNAEGWTWVDGDNLYINSYPLTQWPVGTTFDIRGYVKEVDGCCFLWLDNTFSFGDADGGWATGERTLTAKNGDKTVTSDPFVFHVCNVSILGGRDIQYVFTDAAGGVVYALTEEFYNDLKLSDNTFSENGYTWTEMDYSDMYLRVAKSRTAANINDDSLYNKVTWNELSKRYLVKAYITEKDGSYYMWIKDPSGMVVFTESSRSEWYYISDGKLCYTTFYNTIPGNGVYIQGNLIDLW